MKGLNILIFFASNFLFMAWLFYYLTSFNRRVNKRINYYFDIDRNIKKNKKGILKGEERNSALKRMNEAVREKLSGANQDKIGQKLKSAGMQISPEEYIMMKWFLLAVTGGVLYFLSNNIIFLIVGGVSGFVLPEMWLNRKKNQRIKKFNDGLSDMITTVIGSLRTGYSCPQALKTVVEECESPIKEEVGFMLKEMNYGVSMEDALNNLNARMPSKDLELLTQAILVQRQVGGNLVGVLEIIVKTIRERNRIQRQVQTLTSQGRLSGRVIGSLPIVLGFTIFLINPDYMKTLFTNILGIILISAGVISGIIGFVMINALTKIEV